MNHSISEDDQAFLEQVESCAIPVAEFDHRAHLRLAYIYLVETDVNISSIKTKETLHRLLEHNNIEPSAKYHETLTTAWILAVNHFMRNSESAMDAADFINKNPQLLDSQIMLSHYSSARLFSDNAKEQYISPDLEPIPTYK